MAVAFRSKSELAYGSRTDSTITKPAGVVERDVLLFALTIEANTTAPDLTAYPSGLVPIFEDRTSGPTGGAYYVHYLYLKVAGASEPASYAFTHPTYLASAAVVAYSGVDNTTPLDATPTAASGTGTTATATGLTTVTNSAMLVFERMSWDGGVSTAPTGMTERVDSVVNYFADQIQATAGATGTKAHGSGNGSSFVSWQAYLIPLRPAGTSSSPGAGVGAGAWAFAGAGSGKRAPKASGSGTFTFSGVGAGKRTPKASGAGTASFSGSGTGSTTRRGSGSGTVSLSGSGSGGTVRRGTGSGTLAWSGSGSGAAPAIGGAGGSGSGSVAYVGAGSGKRAPKASGTGAVAFVGAGAGARPAVDQQDGSGVGSWAFAGSGTGKRRPVATGSGSLALVGAGTGTTQRHGVGTGVWTFAGSGVATVGPAIDFAGRIPATRLSISRASGELDQLDASARLSTITATGDLT